MLCEMCGAESALLNTRKISGSILQVCNTCSDSGSESAQIESIGRRAHIAQTLQKRNQKMRYSETDPDENVLISDYGVVIRQAREKLSLDHATLAHNISEKKSIITSVESGNMRPNEKLTKKLERFLKIRLTESVKNNPEPNLKKSRKNLTMGDLLKQSMKEN
ncbi:MAG: multiprotein bridging factor aMBF1 [Candidatus Thermoplasmatota archaeon]|jgi:putative transcription factor|nr:multiprotein bridging factor aMBF1 [Candidatus Thermoplasmatota archaeon]